MSKWIAMTTQKEVQHSLILEVLMPTKLFGTIWNSLLKSFFFKFFMQNENSGCNCIAIKNAIFDLFTYFRLYWKLLETSCWQNIFFGDGQQVLQNFHFPFCFSFLLPSQLTAISSNKNSNN